MAISKKCRHKRPQWDSCGCAWYEDFLDDDKKRVWERLGSTTRPEAEAEAAARKADRLRSRLAADGLVHLRDVPLSLEQAGKLWLDELERLGRAASTVRAHRSRLVRCQEYFGAVAIHTWTSDDIQAFATKLAGSGLTLTGHRDVLATLHSVLIWVARRGGQIPDWPGEFAQPVGRRRRRIPLADALRLVDEIEERYRDLARFVLLTGLRIGEAIAVTPLDIAGGVLHVWRQRTPRGEVTRPKTELGERYVRLSADALALVPMDGPRDRWCWPWAYSTIQGPMASAALRLGLPSRTGWHSLRHANAELRERASEGLRTQQDQLGHSRHWQTAFYGESPSSDPDNLDQAIRDAQAEQDA